MQIILSGFSIDYCYVKIFALGHSVSSFCVMGMRNWHLNTGLKLLLKILPIPVFDPPLMGYACAFQVDSC